ncbi:MAG: cytochrome c [Chitinophagales bacterium]|nr:cytochrome c [Chitinophagales bacterium]
MTSNNMLPKAGTLRRVQGVLLILSAILLAQCEENTYRIGERVYKANCANCHMDNGEGLGELIPPIANSDYLKNNRDKLACIVRYGLKDTIMVNGKQYSEQMAGIKLEDVALVNLLNYIGHSWGNDLKPYTLEEVRTMLGQCATQQ